MKLEELLETALSLDRSILVVVLVAVLDVEELADMMEDSGVEKPGLLLVMAELLMSAVLLDRRVTLDITVLAVFVTMLVLTREELVVELVRVLLAIYCLAPITFALFA